MAHVNLSIIGPSGSTLPLGSSPWDAGVHRVMSGTAGLGLPVQHAAFTESAGDGRRLANVRTSGRLITLALGIFADSRQAVQDGIDVLGDHVAYDDDRPLPRLRATYPDGSARELEFVVTGGGTEGLSDLGEQSARLVLTLDCPDAYWTDVAHRDFVVMQTNDGTPFLETLPNVYLQPSDAFGAVSITNPGKVPSPVDWELHGPFTRVEALKNGEGWAFEEPLALGQTVYITRTPAGIAVVDQTGANRYSGLNAVPRFFTLGPGTSNLTVDVDGTSPETRIIGRYRPRYRQVF